MDLNHKEIFTKVSKKGFALIWSLLMSMIILIMASSMTILVIKELRITSNIDESNRAYLAAEAGMERGMYYIKAQNFAWCPGSVASPTNPVTLGTETTPRNIGTNLDYWVTVRGFYCNGGGTPADPKRIEIESTGRENTSTYRKLKLKIVYYNPTDTIERFNLDPGLISPGLYSFPPTTVASKPIIIQQFDIDGLSALPVGQSFNVGMHTGIPSDTSNDFGVRLTKNVSGTVRMAITGRLNGTALNSLSFSSSGVLSYQDFSPIGKKRVVIEYSRVGSMYSVVRAIVLNQSIVAGAEKYLCPSSTNSYVVFGTATAQGADPTQVKVGPPNPSFISTGGNGFLSPYAGVMIDNMVFWGRE
ncbi:hypothetical protein HGB13_00720 [bacterium]|nr:hypothetical protein [bacterium]